MQGIILLVIRKTYQNFKLRYIHIYNQKQHIPGFRLQTLGQTENPEANIPEQYFHREPAQQYLA